MTLFKLARAGRWEELQPLYHWFLPLLRMDVVPKFVQLIKLAQSRVAMGSQAVRAPRLVLAGDELAQAEAVITVALASRPVLPTV
jgi:4-hydroxy-tetrahydrodipicolinate synthase